MLNFGAALIDSTDATAAITGLTGAVTDNLTIVLPIVVAVAALAWGKRIVSKGVTKGKL